MKILVVSSYPPMKCGIARYASQQVVGLRREGHRVDVLSPAYGDGNWKDNLKGGWRPLRLLRYLWPYDRTYVHFTPYFFYSPCSKLDRLKTSLALLLVMLLAGRRVFFLIHETCHKFEPEERMGCRDYLDRLYWLLAGRVIFHSLRERDVFCSVYKLRRESRAFEVWPHEKYFTRSCDPDRDQARRQLGLEPNLIVFLCLGFIQPHKGFDRAILALSQVPGDHLRLKVVGSVRVDQDFAHTYARLLHALIDRDNRCSFHECYLGDELFDTWIVASDYVVVPYHEIWSSGVAARAKLYGRPLIASRVGGLEEQSTEGSYLFSKDDELLCIIREIAERTARPT
jgi:glycosyltransferase involved in cell wall biosynthesis